MTVYFTSDRTIDPKHAVLFNQIAGNIRKSFTDAIGVVSKGHSENIDWWVSSPASRNTFASPLFHYCCCLALLQELIRLHEPIDEIRTDSRAFKKILERYLASQGASVKVFLVRLPLAKYLKNIFRPIHALLWKPFYYISIFLIARMIRDSRASLPSQKLILVDSFVILGHVQLDRYYTGLLDVLSIEEQQNLWFVPHLYQFPLRHIPRVIKQLRVAKRNVLLKDDFLKLNDYGCLWALLFRVFKIQIKTCVFLDIEISSLVQEELKSFRSISDSYVPLLNFRFAQRLKESGVQLRLVVDWFENQSIDKAWNYGFNRYFPDCKIIGYQGFVYSNHYLSLYPSDEERNSRVIPSKILVMGGKLVEPAKEFCPNLDVELAPAFRYQQIRQEREFRPDPKRYTIMVAPSVHMQEVSYMLKLLFSVVSQASKEVRFLIKCHPMTTQAQIKDAFGPHWPERFEFVEGDFSRCVEMCDLLISVAGTACLEALAKGTPVIIIGNTSGLTQNPIPQDVTSDIWRLCYNAKEVADACLFYQRCSPEKLKEYEAVGRKILEDYFEPVTPEGVKCFLGL